CWRRKQSPLGADLDSLADVISFGVAPAALGFTLGLRTLLDSLVLVFFVCCGLSRLARFNVTAAALSEGTGKVKYYEGTPIPTSLVIVALLGVLYAKGLVGAALPLGTVGFGGATLHPIVLVYALSGMAMASGTLRIPKP
ncbi:MAG: CDP-diacylglycerol--serine O-phosphatidyltransferase, partial [Polyangiaceae bacterium]|nr:CDP-diacylglycerol--serine O-phosphatidyltransferase [Polyangiaceae bacterium]